MLEKDKDGLFYIPDNDITYRSVKCLAAVEIIKDKPCYQDFENYVKHFGYYSEPQLKDVLRIAEEYPSWIPWLLEKGYIVKSESLIDYENVSVGDSFEILKRTYYIMLYGVNSVALLSVNDYMPKPLITRAVRPESITLIEFKRLLDRFAYNWQKIYKTRVKEALKIKIA